MARTLIAAGVDPVEVAAMLTIPADLVISKDSGLRCVDSTVLALRKRTRRRGTVERTRLSTYHARPSYFAITIAGGLIVFGATQLAQRFALDPVTDLMKALGRAAFVVTYYENRYCHPGVNGPWEEAKRELRKSASELEANLRAVRLHRFFSLLKQIPKPPNGSITLLRGLSNAHFEQNPSKAAGERRHVEAECDEVKRLLGI
jgi:hypothetical protein